MRKLYTIIICLCTIMGSTMAQNRLTPEGLWELGRVGGVSISPDQTKIVYGITRYDIASNKGNRDLYLISMNGGDPVKLTDFTGSEFNVTWRPDGKKIGFLATVSGAPQLWEMNPDGTDKKQVSDVEGGIGNFAYSPDMKHVYFSRDVKMDKTVNELYEDLPHADARIIDDLMYRHWSEWHDYAYSHVFFANYKDGKMGSKMWDIMENERFDSPQKPFGGGEDIAWTADGKGITYVSKKLEGKDYALSTNSDIYYYALADGKWAKKGTTINLTEGMNGYDMEPIFSADGKWMMWSSMERDGFESDRHRVFLLNLQTGDKNELTTGLDRDFNHPQFSADGKKVYGLTGEEATYQLCEIDLESRQFRIITEGDHNYTGFSVVGDYFIATKQTMSMPTEIYKVHVKSGKEQQLTFTNQIDLANMDMGRVEARWVKTTDKKQMKVWVIYPPNFDPNKKYPALLYCQGGPQSAVSQFFSYRWNFQLMAANDYIVIAPNRRGLPSFGRAWNDEISKDWGGQAMDDYLSAVDAIKKEPYVDEDNIGAVGASYGGYSVYWLAGNHNKRFNAFISHCGLFNLESWYGTTEELFFANWDHKGPYWETKNKSNYTDFSPHKFVQNWDAPMMVIHGEKDFRVPIGEGMQAFQAAQLQGIPSRFLYFPEENHWVLNCQNGILWHRVFFDWLDTHLKK